MIRTSEKYFSGKDFFSTRQGLVLPVRLRDGSGTAPEFLRKFFGISSGAPEGFPKPH
jgi:hypothetical protein